MDNRRDISNVQPMSLSVPRLHVTSTYNNTDDEQVTNNFTIKERREKGDETVPVTEHSIRSQLRTYLLITQWCLLFPVEGILEEDSDFRFSWSSRGTKLSLLMLLISIISFMVNFFEVLSWHRISWHSIETNLTQIVPIFLRLMFLKQARNWPSLMKEWTSIELKLKPLGLESNLHQWFNKLIIFGIVSTIVLVLIEFLESIGKVLACSEDLWTVFKLSVVGMNYVFYSNTSFSLWKAAIPFVLNVMDKMLWMLMNLKIVLLSSCIAAHFRRINQRLSDIQHKRMPRTFWLYMRELYNSVSGLSIRLDQHLSWMNVYCFGEPIYNITSIMLITITATDTLNWVGNLYKLFYLTVTFLTTSFVASTIHEESKVPLQILFSVPAESFNNEVARFQTQVCQSEMALTGCNYFSITRSFILTVAGTIVTYEIVLVQFGSIDIFKEDLNSTSFCQPLLDILGTED